LTSLCHSEKFKSGEKPESHGTGPQKLRRNPFTLSKVIVGISAIRLKDKIENHSVLPKTT